MAHISVGGVSIHFEQEGSGPPVVLQHGLTDSIASWYEYGYVDALAPRYGLILIDARGHGASDKPHEPTAYAGSTLALDVVAVLDHLGIERASYFGHSMGGAIGISLAHHAPDRIDALGIGASPPDPTPSATVDSFVPLLQQGPAAMLSAWQQLGTLSPEMTERILAIDCEAIIALIQAERTRITRDVDAFHQLQGRYRFFMGDADWFLPDMLRAADKLEAGALVTIAGVNHLEFFQRSDLLVPHLTSFLDGRSLGHD